MLQLHHRLSKLLPIARNGITCNVSQYHSPVLRQIHEHYYSHFLNNPKYRTVARSDLNLQKELLNRHFLQVNPAGLSDTELLQAILLCRDSSVFKSKWKDLDRECCKRISKFSFSISVQIMDSWITQLGNTAFNGEFFACAVAYWALHVRFSTKEEFVHLVYLLSRKKSVPENLSSSLSTNLYKFLPSLTPRELAVVCSSLFKLKCKDFDFTTLNKVATEVEQLMLLHEDRFDLISVLKFLRMCKYYKETLLAKLTSYILAQCDTFNVTECAHFLATYSSVKVCERDVFEKLEARAFSSLKTFIKRGVTIDSKMHPSIAPRIKDVARVLWALASVGHQISNLNSTMAVQFIEDNFHPDTIPHVLDALQSLACFGVYPEDLTCRACASITENHLTHHPKKKLFQQFVFVKNSALIMLSRQKLPPLLMSHAVDASLIHRPSLMNLINLYNSEGLCPSCILPHIRIAGVALVVASALSFTPVNNLEDLLSRTRRTVHVSPLILKGLVGHNGLDKIQDDSVVPSSVRIPVSIEVLDHSVTLRNSSASLLGVMRAKVEQLKTLGIKVVFLTPSCIESLSKLPHKSRRDWLNDVLRDCIKLSQSELFYSSENV
ncbi:uncharacterized protein LOC135393099 [Ornithodoros turicata]|uniref:uncharacterized protein LOC135393099 n=1 Tax=Ornithodoros turicata TaxID=34597 RepID=UPI003138833E